MRTYKLTPWSFEKDEMVTLYWLSSPFKVRNGEELIVAYFKTESGAFKSQVYPWGTLPLLKMGGEYKNGSYIGVKPSLIRGTLPVNYITRRVIGTAYSLIPPDLYTLKKVNKNKSAGFENCAELITENDTKYIIPCLELVRAIFASTRFFANQLLSTAALDECATEEELIGDSVRIAFSPDFPLELFNIAHITEYAWIKHTDLYMEWKGIYARRAGETSSSKKNIIANLPLYGNETIEFCGLRQGNTVLILNISLDIDMPFSEIIASHPKHNCPDDEQPPTRTKYIGKPLPDVIELEGEGVAARGGNAVTIEDGAPSKSFRSKPKVRLISGQKKEGRPSRRYVEAPSEDTYSMQDTLLRGKARPVEIMPDSNISSISDVDGFEDFCKMLRYLNCNISVSKGNFLGSGKDSFTTLSDGSERQYLIVECTFATSPNLTIIEAQSTGWPLSTLIIRGPRTNPQLATMMIGKLSENSGHWDSQWFSPRDEYNIFRLKHYEGRHPKHWASLIANFRYIQR